MKGARLAFVSSVAVAIAGCASDFRSSGANTNLVAQSAVARVDLIQALDPSGHRTVTKEGPSVPRERGFFGSFFGTPGANTPDADTGSADKYRRELEVAFAAFYEKYPDPVGRRNRLLDRLVAASNSNCASWQQDLTSVQSTTNFLSGALATGVTAAGAIVTNVESARLLSGIGSAIIGVRAEYNEDFFRSNWMESIVRVIENERGALRVKHEESKRKDISEYTVEAAVGDAIIYNDTCSLVSGLRLTNKALSVSEDPAGMRAFRAAFRESGFEPTIGLVPATQQLASNKEAGATVGQATMAPGAVVRGLSELQSIAKTTAARLTTIDGASSVVEGVVVKYKAKIQERVKGVLPSFELDGKEPLGVDQMSDSLKKLNTQIKNLSNDYEAAATALATAGDEASRLSGKRTMASLDSAASALLRDVLAQFADVQSRINKDFADAVIEAKKEPESRPN